MVVKSNFSAYMAQIDEHIQTHLGFEVSDLPEYDYFSAYSEGLTVEEAATCAVIAAEGN